MTRGSRVVATGVLLAAWTAGCVGMAASPKPVLTATPTAAAAGAAPSAAAPTAVATGRQAGWIGYQADGGIGLVRPDGSGAHLIRGLPETAAHPDWSSDGSRLVFVVDEDDSRDIWIANADGGEARVLVDCEAPCVDADGPAFAPDGESIAYRVFDIVDGAFPGSRVEVLELATNAVRVVTSTAAPDYIGNGTGIRWSRDGRSLVFDISTIVGSGTEAERVTGSAIALADAAGADLPARRITDLETFPSYPDWSPVDDVIVFMARLPVASDADDVVFNLFTVGVDGETPAQLTALALGGDPWGPTWSRDGRSIWVTIRTPELTIGSVDAATGELHPLAGPVPGAHPRET